MTRASYYVYFTDQLRRRTQLTGLLKVFFTTDFRRLVTLAAGKLGIWLTFGRHGGAIAKIASYPPSPLVSTDR